jgi:hypothetical protein
MAGATAYNIAGLEVAITPKILLPTLFIPYTLEESNNSPVPVTTALVSPLLLLSRI